MRKFHMPSILMKWKRAAAGGDIESEWDGFLIKVLWDKLKEKSWISISWWSTERTCFIYINTQCIYKHQIFFTNALKPHALDVLIQCLTSSMAQKILNAILNFIEKSTTLSPLFESPSSRVRKQQQEISIFFLNYTLKSLAAKHQYQDTFSCNYAKKQWGCLMNFQFSNLIQKKLLDV